MLLNKVHCVSRTFSVQQEFMSAMRGVRVRLLVAVVFVFACVALPTGTAHADVTYQSDAHTFAVRDADGRPVDDLFSNFKNVMPGDILTQQVTITNKGMNAAPAKLYLRSTGVLAGSAPFLSMLNLSVTAVDAGNGSKLFNSPPSQKANLADWVCLGTFAPGAHVTLNLVLEVPLTMGNEFQDASGAIGWEFMAEELTEGDNDSSGGGNDNGSSAESLYHSTVKTGDPLNAAPFVLVALSALMVVAACRLSRR